MPELPEVETTVRGLQRVLPGLVVTDVWTDLNSPSHKHARQVKHPSYFASFKKHIVGQKITHMSRRGKHVVIHLESGDHIVIHMKMTGHLLYGTYTLEKKKWRALEPGPLQDPFNGYIHLVFSLSDGKSLALSDARKFAKIILIGKKAPHNHNDFELLGPEPLPDSFTLAEFKTRIQKKPNSPAKKALLDQSLVAGIGNIYSDEILWQGCVLPTRKVTDISDTEWKNMFTAMKAVFEKSISMGGDSLSDYRNPFGEKGGFQKCHEVYRRTKLPCKRARCPGIIARTIVGGRSAHYCPVCQN